MPSLLRVCCLRGSTHRDTGGAAPSPQGHRGYLSDRLPDCSQALRAVCSSGGWCPWEGPGGAWGGGGDGGPVGW